MSSNYFALHEEIADATTAVNIDAAIRCLVEGGAPEEASLLCPAGGPVVMIDPDGIAYVVDEDSHSINFASSGRGKSRRNVLPMTTSLILAGNNIVVNDMKGEIYRAMAPLLLLAGYTTYVLDLRNPIMSPHRYNPLTLAWDEWHEGNDDIAFLRLRNFGRSLFDNQRKGGIDPFWPDSSTDYFVGLALGALEAGVTREGFTLESIAAMDLVGEREAPSGQSYLKRMFGFFPAASVALQNVSGTLFAPDRTRQSIQATFRSPISLYAGQRGLMDVLCRSDFNVNDLARERTALFVISPDESHSLGPIVVGLLNQIMSGLITHAQNEHDGVLPHRVDFVIDEMGNLPTRVPDLEALVSAARSRNIRFHFVFQSAEQLTNVYGNEIKEVILDNCDTLIFMGSRGLPFLHYISDLAGTVRLESGEERPLLSVDKLQHLEKRRDETEALVFLSNLRPFVSALKDIDRYERPVADLTTPVEKKRVRHEVFDITAVRKGDIIIPGSMIQRYGQPPGDGTRKSVQTTSRTPADGSSDGKSSNETYDLQRELEKKFDELFGSSETDG